MSEPKNADYGKAFEEKLRADVVLAASQYAHVSDMIAHLKSLGYPYLFIYSAIKQYTNIAPLTAAKAIVRAANKGEAGDTPAS